jgi:DNA modification methylase
LIDEAEKKFSEDVNGNYNPRNSLNDLTGKEWIRFTKSWFVCNPKSRKGDEILHPAKYPEEMVREFIEFFTKKGQSVLDPFLGTGSTLVACNECGRIGFGIELIDKYAKIATRRAGQRNITDLGLKQTVISGDARLLTELLPPRMKEMGVKEIDFVITSPPYWSMLKTSRGGVVSASKKRLKTGLDTYYSEKKRDLGNIASYEDFLDELSTVFRKCAEVMRDGAYMVVIVQNIMPEDGEMRPLAWDIARKISEVLVLKQERIWCQDNKPLGIWGYPKTYVSNVHHHYCLIFQKQARGAERAQ